MASTGSKIKSLKKAKTQVKELKTKMTKYASYIDSISNQLAVMMKGNGTDSYWQGAVAQAWYTKAIGSKGLSGIIGNYANSYREFSQYAVKIEKADVKASLKGAKKSSIKTFLAKCDGSSYTNGVAKNKDDKRIAAIPATVNADSVNDDQTRESYRSYMSLRDSLDQLIQNSSSIIKLWNEVASNTTGKMSDDAKKRASTMQTRKKQISTLREELEEEYIGDILFS